MKKTGLIAASAVSLLLSCEVGRAQTALPAYKVIAHIPGPDGRWDYATFDSASRRVYLAKNDRIISLDAATGRVNPQVASGTDVHIATPLPGNRLLITNGELNNATIVSAATGKVLATIATGGSPDGAVFDPGSGLAFVADHTGGDVVFVDPGAQTSVGAVMVGGVLEFLAPDGKGHLFVNVTDKGEIAKIDIGSKTLQGLYKIDGCDRPGGLAYVAAAKRLVAACNNKTAAVIDPDNGQTVDRLVIGDHPDAVIYDPVRKLAFIPCAGDGTLAVLAVTPAGKLAVAQTVPTMTTARTGALDPKTGRLYLPAVKTGEAAQAGGRAPTLPGTFEFVVVGP